MKEPITKFDLEAAFKALDEIEVPVAEKGIKANKPALTEIFSRKSKFDTLMEEYYDIGNTEELADAQEAREAEVAKAKLARIEKIVDLDAESPEELLTSYVGKLIMQCPQCMTLFYKNPEDIEDSEEEPGVVNVNEVCQHCGNDSGYTLIGKVGEATQEEVDEMQGEQEVDVDSTVDSEEDLDLEIEDDEAAEESSEDFDLEALDLDLEDEEEEKTEESFTSHEGELLVEDVQDDKELDAKLDAHNEYIEYLRAVIADEEAKLEKVDNEQVKAAIQRRIDAYKEDLEKALPDEVKNEMEAAEEPVEEPEPEDTQEITESLKEAADLEVSAEEFEDLISSPEFKKPVSDSSARAMMQEFSDSEEAESKTEALKEGIFDKIKDKVKDKFNKVADSLKSREAKADWILENAVEDFSDVEIGEDGTIKTDSKNKLFNYFITVCYADKYSNGKFITMAPSYDNKDLQVVETHAKKSYKNADDIAKGWSMKQSGAPDGGRPAHIYLAKDAQGNDAVFLCAYFKGELIANSDMLENYFKTVKQNLEGDKLMNRAKDATNSVKASELKAGMKVKLEDGSCEVLEVGSSKFDSNSISAKIKFSDGSTETYTFDGSKKLAILDESLDSIMNEVDELQEDCLETLVANSLVEAYQNVAGFRLNKCAFLNEQLTIDGTIYFTSGNTRKTTYVFTEAFTDNTGKMTFKGLNAKLGLDKKFTLSGRTTNKTLITESFICSKN